MYIRKNITEMITESLTEFERCPIGHSIYLRITFYTNGAILSEIRHNDELISSIHKEDITGSDMLDYIEYNRDSRAPNLCEIISLKDAHNIVF